MAKLIGTKNIFAIEIEFHKPLASKMGSLRIWLGGKSIGYFDDVNILSVTLYQLKRISYEKLCDKKFEGMDPKDGYLLIKSNCIENSGRYYLSFGESFDDFSVIVYGVDDNLVFAWQLNESHFFDYFDYPLGLHYAIVPYGFFIKIVGEFEDILIQGSSNNSV